VERRGAQVVHQELRRAADGRVLTALEAEVQYVLGSGTHGRAYLIQRDGFLFQSPISWYTRGQVWGLDPSAGTYESRQFYRPVSTRCLFCHGNDARPVADTLNRSEVPPFRSPAIGCERCHGPGELHVARRERGEPVADLDDTIVNPQHLKSELREAVCWQCHLQGEVRILPHGRQLFDYRPGLPLADYWSIFGAPRRLTADPRSGSQA